MNLDFDEFPKVENGYLLMPSPPEELKCSIDIYDRFCATLYMAGKIGGDSDKSVISSSARSEAFVRAALCEFVGIEELLKHKYSHLGTSLFKIYKSTNPILHMLKLLRNYNIHLRNSTLNNKNMRVKALVKDAGDFDYEVKVISNLSVSEIKKLKSSKDYSEDNLKRMIACFEEQQHQFGLHTLIIKQTLNYSETVIDALKSK